MSMNLVLTILIGVGIGMMVELLLPGHTLCELMLAMFLGAAGALVARYLGERNGWFEREEPASFIVCAAGAIVVLLVYGAVFRRHKRRPVG